MNKHTTKAIVLKRVNFGDSDRMITILSPEFGKVSLMAKGVRKINSKLAGGIELFSISDIGYVMGRGDVGRLTSSRLIEYYPEILKDINRVQLGYEILKVLNKNLEDSVESDYFYILCQLLRLLNDDTNSTSMIRLYYRSRLLRLSGHMPNLKTDDRGQPLTETNSYSFITPSMSLVTSNSGRLKAKHIKLLRLLFDTDNGEKVFKVEGPGQLEAEIEPIIDAMFMDYLSL